jgi:hypothetical protein
MRMVSFQGILNLCLSSIGTDRLNSSLSRIEGRLTIPSQLS